MMMTYLYLTLLYFFRLQFIKAGEWRQVYEFDYYFATNESEWANWTEAERACSQIHQAQLAVLWDNDERDLVSDTMRDLRLGTVFIGFIRGNVSCGCRYETPTSCNECRNTWVWYDGTQSNVHLHWHSDTPSADSDCSLMSYTGYIYTDGCAIDHNYACKKVPEIISCEHHRCTNGAICESTDSLYRCVCQPGFEGRLCDAEIDECSSNPCRNGGQCQDRFNGFECFCSHRYSGVLCEAEATGECASSPCMNNGACNNEETGFECTCIPGFQGDRCEIDTNECTSSPCQHEAICSDALNGYVCGCINGYRGTHCETGLDESSANENEGFSKELKWAIIGAFIAGGVLFIAGIAVVAVLCLRHRSLETKVDTYESKYEMPRISHERDDSQHYEEMATDNYLQPVP